MRHRELLINGFFFGGPCDSSVGKEIVREPWTGSPWATVAEGGWSELSTAIECAEEAFRTWKHSSVILRQELLLRIATLVRDRSDELVETLVEEIGKPIPLAKGEVDRMAITFETAARALDRWGEVPIDISLDPRSSDFHVSSHRVPRGVVLAIVPYNWPFNLAAHKIAPALAIGCTVVMKVSPTAAYSGLTLARLIHEAGCPPGVLNAWNGPTALMSKVINHPKVNVVSFTGSAAVGWEVAKLPRSKHVVLELGGDASVVFLSGTDIEAAVPRVVASAFGYAGQVCISAQHLWVHADDLERVSELLVSQTRALARTDATDRSGICGPMISVEAATRVKDWIDEAVEGGGQVLVGGEREGNFVEPTLVLNPPKNSRLANEEVFGPVLTLRSYTNPDEPRQAINGSRYGIHASVFGTDASTYADTLEIAGVVIDDAPTVRFDAAPYGGVRESGLGREGVWESMLEFSTPKTTIRRTT